jgi:hypothetical protein
MKLRKLKCYKVVLAVTNSMGSCACIDGDGADKQYIDVEGGVCFYVAESMAEVGEMFPEALNITYVGIAHEHEE